MQVDVLPLQPKQLTFTAARVDRDRPERCQAVSACVKVTRTIEPRPEWIEPYAAARERFRGLYPALRPLQV